MALSEIGKPIVLQNVCTHMDQECRKYSLHNTDYEWSDEAIRLVLRMNVKQQQYLFMGIVALDEIA